MWLELSFFISKIHLRDIISQLMWIQRRYSVQNFRLHFSIFKCLSCVEYFKKFWCIFAYDFWLCLRTFWILERNIHFMSKINRHLNWKITKISRLKLNYSISNANIHLKLLKYMQQICKEHRHWIHLRNSINLLIDICVYIYITYFKKCACLRLRQLC